MAGKVLGADKILKNLNIEISKIEGDISKGLSLALVHVQGEAQENTPLEFGVLRNSAFTDVGIVNNRVVGRIGFRAKYAPYVHEMPMKRKGQKRVGRGPDGKPRKGNYWVAGQNKFLERTLVENAPQLPAFIRKHAKR